MGDFFNMVAWRRWPFQLLIATVIVGFIGGDADAQSGAAARPESVCVARDNLRRELPKADAEGRDRMFREFRTYYVHSAGTTSRAFSAIMDKYTDDYEEWLTKSDGKGSVQAFLKERPDIAHAGAGWFDCGFLMYDGEGALYPVPDPDFLPALADQLSPDLASYVRFRAREDRDVVMDDAALQISWEDLRMRLERWEDFGVNHPNLPETKSEVEPYVQALAGVYFFGSDNTPIYDSATGKIKKDLLSSWSDFAADNRSSRYHSLVSSLIKNVSEQDRTMTPADRPLFELAGLGKEFDQWWRQFQVYHGSPKR